MFKAIIIPILSVIIFNPANAQQEISEELHQDCKTSSLQKNSQEITIQCFESKKDTDTKTKKSWTLTYNFGFTRTHYYPTTMKLRADGIDIVIEDYTFIERTSASYYNPKNWKRLGDAFRWIDEPTNKMTLELSNGKDIFSVRAFHPKFLNFQKQEYWVRGTLNGEAINEKITLDGSGEDFWEKPNRPALVRLQNTHRQMEYTVGYGRALNLIQTKAGHLSIIPSAHLGFMSGATKSSYRTDPQYNYWTTKDYVAKEQIQGISYGFSSMIKWQKNGFSLFAEGSIQQSHLHQDFLSTEGSAQYKLLYTAGTVGFSVRLAKFKGRK